MPLSCCKPALALYQTFVLPTSEFNESLSCLLFCHPYPFLLGSTQAKTCTIRQPLAPIVLRFDLSRIQSPDCPVIYSNPKPSDIHILFSCYLISLPSPHSLRVHTCTKFTSSYLDSATLTVKILTSVEITMIRDWEYSFAIKCLPGMYFLLFLLTVFFLSCFLNTSDFMLSPLLLLSTYLRWSLLASCGLSYPVFLHQTLLGLFPGLLNPQTCLIVLYFPSQLSVPPVTHHSMLFLIINLCSTQCFHLKCQHIPPFTLAFQMSPFPISLLRSC